MGVLQLHNIVLQVERVSSVDDIADEVGAVYGDATRSEDYSRKLRDYMVDFPGTTLQRLLNRTRVTH